VVDGDEESTTKTKKRDKKSKKKKEKKEKKKKKKKSKDEKKTKKKKSRTDSFVAMLASSLEFVKRPSSSSKSSAVGGRGDDGALETEPVDFPVTAAAYHRNLLAEVFTKNDPYRLQHVDELLVEYKGEEDELYDLIARKYKLDRSTLGLAPTDVVTVANDAVPDARSQQQTSSARCPKEVLVPFYTVYDPSKIADVDAIIAKYEGREEEMYRYIAVKYKVKPSIFGLSSTGNPREILVPFYQVYNPSKLPVVDDLIAKYWGKEKELYEILVQKYNVDRSIFGLTSPPPTMPRQTTTTITTSTLPRANAPTNQRITNTTIGPPPPPGAPPGGEWGLHEFCGEKTFLLGSAVCLLCGILSCLLFLCPVDSRRVYRAPNGSLWSPSGGMIAPDSGDCGSKFTPFSRPTPTSAAGRWY